MAFTVDDFYDLIRLLAEHPELNAELRRHIVPDELLEIPALMRQLAESQLRTEQLLQALTGRVDRLESDVAELKTDVKVLKADVAELKADVKVLKTDVKVLKTDVGALKGDSLERRYRERSGAYFHRLARGLRLIDSNTLAELLLDAVDEGRLTADERSTILDTDIVLAGQRLDDRVPVYLLVEVSATIDRQDVERAAERSALLERLGQPVIPVVAGNVIDPRVAALAQAEGVRQILDGRQSSPRIA